MARINKTFTVGATPLQIDVDPIPITRIFVQMLPGGAGAGYVMDGIYGGRTPSTANASDVTAVLAKAVDATTPGGSYSDTDPTAGIVGNAFWVHGDNAGDKIKVSYNKV